MVLRRFGLATMLAALALAAPATMPAIAQSAITLTQAQQTRITAINQYLSSLGSMQGQFVQTATNGQYDSGIFVIQRPGRLLFQYAPQPPMRELIANGTDLAVIDRRTGSLNVVPLRQTPLRFLLQSPIDIATAGILTAVDTIGDRTQITLRDPNVEGSITIVFDNATNALLGWTIVEGSGVATNVVLQSTEVNRPTDPAWFVFDYDMFR